MAALDTNILVRWFTNDDTRQSAKAAALISRAALEGRPLFVPVTVILEMEWVLRSRYAFSQDEIAGAMDRMMSAPELEMQEAHAVEMALWAYKNHSPCDFADCLHAALVTVHHKQPLYTFDIMASRLEGASKL